MERNHIQVKKKKYYLLVVNGKFFAEYLILSMDSVCAPLERFPSLHHIFFTISNLSYTANSKEDERIAKITHTRGTRTTGIRQMERVIAEQEKNDKCRAKLSSGPTEGFHNTKLSSGPTEGFHNTKLSSGRTEGFLNTQHLS
jgi:hypothetical protein